MTTIDKDQPADDKRPLKQERPKALQGADARTPASDMQPEDAGTAASGNDEGSASESAMKQTSKPSRPARDSR